MSERTIDRVFAALTLGVFLTLAGAVIYLEVGGAQNKPCAPKNCHHH
jgi:hypothetical protein